MNPEKYKGVAHSIGSIIVLLVIAVISIYSIVRLPKSNMKDVVQMVLPALLSIGSYMWGKKGSEK